MSQDLCAEPRNIHALLAGGTTGLPAAAPAQPPLAQVLHAGDDSGSSSDEEQLSSAPSRKIKAGNTANPERQAAHMAELDRQLSALRQQLAEEGDRSRRLEAALEAARQDGTLVGGRLKSELAAKQEEVSGETFLFAWLRYKRATLKSSRAHKYALKRCNNR